MFVDFQKRASDKNIKVDDTTVVEEDEFTTMATNRSTPQSQPKVSTNVMDELMGLDTQWGGVANNNPWGAPTPASNNPFSVGGAVGGGMSSNPWGTSGGILTFSILN